MSLSHFASCSNQPASILLADDYDSCQLSPYQLSYQMVSEVIFSSYSIDIKYYIWHSISYTYRWAIVMPCFYYTANFLLVDSNDLFCVQNPTVVHRYFLLINNGFSFQYLGQSVLPKALEFTNFISNFWDPDLEKSPLSQGVIQ